MQAQKSIFKQGKKEGITAVLAAKDKRVAMQQTIFKSHPQQTLVDVKLNIPGPIKNNLYLEKLFEQGIKELESRFKKNDFHYHLLAKWDKDTGSEAFYVLSQKAKQVKLTCIAFEDQSPIGRLFDADVLVKDKRMALSRKNLGQPSRKCFLCERPAKECARSRRHSVSELQAYISRLYWRYVN